MTSEPKLYKGDYSEDQRGTIFHNNNFDFEQITRGYLIENNNTHIHRGWKGHAIEKRWFLCTRGIVTVKVISIKNLENKIDNSTNYELTDSNLDILEVPAGYATMIQQKLTRSRVLCFSDYRLNTSNDENLRWSENYLEI